jgi:predicted DsbA family dithiol-disulfide isomerase
MPAIALLASVLWANLAAGQMMGDPAKQPIWANTPVAARQEAITDRSRRVKAAEVGEGFIIRSYPVRDLFTFRIARNPSAADAAPLVEMITDAYIATAWKDTDPPQIEFVDSSGSLAICQPPAVQEKIMLLLTALRQARNRQVQPQPAQDVPPIENQASRQTHAPITVQTEAEQAVQDRILAILQKPYASKTEKVPLSDVLAEIARSTGLPIQVDKEALSEATIPLDSPVNCELPESVPLRTALSLILGQVGLVWTIDNQSLLVTTPDKASTLLVVRVYPVQDLVAVSEPMAPRAANYWRTTAVIREAVSPTTWSESGSRGSINSFAPSGSIIVSQTFAAHEQIALLLSAMRKVRDEQAQPTITVETEAEQAAEDRIDTILQKPFFAKFEQKPLAGVLADITRSTGLPIHVDRKTLEEASKSLDMPVSCQVSDVSLRSALRLILGQLDLTSTTRDGVLMVTTPDKASNLEIIRVYPVRDLVSVPTEANPLATNPQPLNSLIIDLIAPTTWFDGAGPGPQFFNAASGSFVISQTLSVHEQIALLLSALRKARDRQHMAHDAPGGEKLTAEQAQAPITVQTEAEQAAEDRIRAILQKPISVKFQKTPLANVLAEITRSAGLPIQLDSEALADASIRLDSPVSCEVPQEMPLRSALGLILEGLHLAWAIDHEWVLVTTSDKADFLPIIKVYPVLDLVAAPNETNPRAANDLAIQAIVKQITDGIAPATWSELGGPGGIEQFSPSGAIVISQSSEVHGKIAKLLATLRKVRRREAQHAESDKPAEKQPPAKTPREPVAPGAGGGIF